MFVLSYVSYFACTLRYSDVKIDVFTAVVGVAMMDIITLQQEYSGLCWFYCTRAKMSC